MGKQLQEARPPDWAFAEVRPARGDVDQADEGTAIPAREYSADERAERTRGSAIVFLLLAAAAIGIFAAVFLIWAIT